MSNEDIINARKQVSKINRESRNSAKLNYCLYCGKRTNRFCNSHSVPQFVLKNIDKEGKVDYFNSLFHLPLMNNDVGISEAGTFHLLCRECDNNVFSDYEDQEKINQYPSQKILTEIALKNYLVFLGKRYFEIELYSIHEKKYHAPLPYEAKRVANVLDLSDFQLHYNKVKDMLEYKTNDEMHILFWKKLDYVVPIAYQGAVTLYCDLKGEIINDVYNNSPDIKMKYLHISIFPLEKESIIIAFYDDCDTEYEGFEEQFNDLSEDEKLELIHFIIFKYSEDMFLSKEVLSNERVMKRLKIVAASGTYLFESAMDGVENYKAKQGLVRRKKIPNLLCEEYKMQVLSQ